MRLFTSAPLPLRSTSEGIHNDVFIILLSPFTGSFSRHHCGVYEMIKGKFWGTNVSQEVKIWNPTLKKCRITCLFGVLFTVFLIIKLYVKIVNDFLPTYFKSTLMQMILLKFGIGVSTKAL